MTNSIWATAEVMAWCRNFDYEDYSSLHSKLNIGANAVSEQTYKLLCEAFENEFEDDESNRLGHILSLDY